MILTLKTLMESKCQNLYNDIILAGTLHGATVHVDDNIANTILSKCKENVEIQPVVTITKQLPLPYEQWPWAFKILHKTRNKEDKGLGDLVSRVIGPIGGDVFKKWWKTIMKTDCNCGARKDFLNERYPF
jgi:hypothetical protein